MENLSAAPDIWHELAIAACLVLILEGMFPFLLPAQWRQWILSISSAPEGVVRLSGLFSMLLGLALLYLVN